VTGSPCEVDLLGDAAITARGAAARLAERDGTRFDGAVLEVGRFDAMRLAPVADWGARLADLLDAVQAALPAGAPVVLVGVPDVHVPDRVRSINPLVLRHARRLDRVAKRLAEVRPGVLFLPAPRLHGFVGRRPSSELAAACTTPIATVLATAAGAPGRPGRMERFDRPEVHTLVETAADEDVAALHGVAHRAAAELLVDEAMISLLDGDLTWHVTGATPAPVPAPASLTCCQTVVATDDALVVEDAAEDPRFTVAGRTAPHAFYAGVPIHAADGTAIGVLCVRHRSARPAASVPVERLRDFAHEAERVLRRATATDRPPAVPAG
jgi:GAF domain-containing protein